MKVTQLESMFKKNPPGRFCNSKNSVCAYMFAILNLSVTRAEQGGTCPYTTAKEARCLKMHKSSNHACK